MTAPTVQTLDEIMASLQPGYAEQQGIIGKQIANTDATNKAQKLALDAAKTQGFNQINTQATGKGNTFSGIPVDEQANYLSTTYLPGIQKADADTNAAKLTLAGQAAELNTNQRTTALGVQQNQTSALNSWNLNERNIAATAAENAANRAANAAENAEDDMSPDEAALAIATQWTQTGEEMPASVFQNMRDAYRLAGGDTGTFAKTYWHYVPEAAQKDFNKLGWKYYYGGE